MTHKELAEILGDKQSTILKKCNSSNRVTRLVTRTLLRMPVDLVQAYAKEEIAKDDKKQVEKKKKKEHG